MYMKGEGLFLRTHPIHSGSKCFKDIKHWRDGIIGIQQQLGWSAFCGSSILS
jgi:hypothetical protein